MLNTTTRASSRSVSRIAAALAILAVAGAITCAAAQERWYQAAPNFVPPGRDDHVMCFDGDRGLVVMFGGDEAGSATWVWNGQDWKDLGLDLNPAPRRESAMAYDSKRKIVVLFGGYDYIMTNASTWEFDGQAWTNVLPEASPAARSDHAMVFDEASGVVVMFGGESVDDSTWAYDGRTWYSINQEGDSPGGRWGHAMACDSDRGVIVLFGGADASNYLRNDTWEWDGEKWTDVTPEEANPPEMRDHVMVYDSHRKVVVLFGGRDNDPDGFDGTWEWDGAQWREIDCLVKPSARHESAAAFDGDRNRLVLFGGSSGSGYEGRYKNDTWWYPNGPPVIEHEAIKGAFPDRPLAVGATIEDYEKDRVEARVFYRTLGEASYKSVSMEKTSGANYAGDIPADGVTDDGLEYYIRATDPNGSGRFSLDTDAEEPHIVSVGETGILRVWIMPKNARKAGAAWRIKGTGEWLKASTVMKNLTPGTITVEFKSIEKWKKPADMQIEIINGQASQIRVSYFRE